MLGQIQAPQDSALWCTTGRDQARPAFAPAPSGSSCAGSCLWSLQARRCTWELHTHTHPSPGPGLMTSILHPSGLCAAVLLGTPGTLQLCRPAAPIPPQLVVEPGAAVCNLSGCFALLPPASPPQAHWFSSQLNEALNQRIIQL